MIDKKTIEQVSKLARLYISEVEAQEYLQQLSKALNHFDQISIINTEGVEPLVTPTEVETYWREDEVEALFTAEQMIENSPEKIGNLFKVPPVV